VSFLPVLRGEKPTVRQGIVSQSINGSFALRDGPWKLCLSAGSGGWSSPKPGPEEAGLPPVQLYDLSKDPGEKTNLQAQFPERVAAMKAELEKIIARGRSTPGEDLKNDVPVQLIKKSPAGKAKAKKK
jgi:arylsulfatase A-like enzyme